MNFPQPLLRGQFIKRYKRFFTDIELLEESPLGHTQGEIITAHCPNTGSMKTCIPKTDEAPTNHGWEALLLPVDDPKRKLKYTLEATITPKGAMVGVNTHRTNQVALEALQKGLIPALGAYAPANGGAITPEVKYGRQNSRIDALLQAPNLPNCYVEVKNTTLMEEPGLATFPDAVTTRGTKHLQELTEMAQHGHRAVMLYVVNRTDATQFNVAEHIDPVYAQTLQKAIEQGVEVLAWRTQITPKEIILTQKVDILV